MANEFIARNGFRSQNNSDITGSLTVSSSNANQFQVGSNLVYVSSSGNVGIGTTSPSYLLDVNGTAKIQKDGAGTYSLYTTKNISGSTGAYNATSLNSMAVTSTGTGGYQSAALKNYLIINQNSTYNYTFGHEWSAMTNELNISSYGGVTAGADRIANTVIKSVIGYNRSITDTLIDLYFLYENYGTVGTHWGIYHSSTDAKHYFEGKMMIGTGTDFNYKFRVLGSSSFSGNVNITGSATNSLRVKGSGATSATNTMLVENSAGISNLTIADNGNSTFNVGTGSLMANVGSTTYFRVTGSSTLGGIAEIFHTNGGRIGRFSGNSGGTVAGLNIDFYDLVTFNTLNSSITFNQTSPIGWRVYSGYNISFLGYSGYGDPNGGEIIMKDNLTGNEAFHAYLGLNQRIIMHSSSLAIGKSSAPNAKLDITGSAIITGSLLVSGSSTVTGSFTVFTGSAIEFQVNATGVKIGNLIGDAHTVTGSLGVSGSVNVVAAVTSSTALISGSGTSRLTVIGSGSSTPIFTVQGSQGELFSVTDSLSGSLFSVNDISGLPILEVFSDNTTLIGDYQAPSLYTTKKISGSSGINLIYSLNTGSYDGVFMDYTAKSGSNARAGNFAAIWSGSSVNYMDNSTTDFGNTSGLVFGASISGSNMIVTGSASTSGWTIKAIIKSI